MEGRTVLGLTATALGIGLVARKCCAASAAATKEQPDAAVTAAPLAGRTAHWVIRCTDLKPFLEFARAVFGMKVIRHEENSEPCNISCNGRYNNAWSKTMVGYNDEAFAYCLEVAYNYGVYDYDPGNGLLSIGIAVPDVGKAIGAAQKLGYAVEGATIVGPDGYKYEVSELTHGRAEPFQFVKTVVTDVAASKEFYIQTMGMADLSTSAHVCVGYSGTQVPLILEQGAVDWQEYSGRHAISIPEKDLLGIYSRVGGDVQADETTESSASPSVVHHIRTFHEVDPVTNVGLGDLRIAIIKDPDDYEICIVSSETFDKAVANPPWIGPDELQDEDVGSWAWRRTKIDATAKKKDKGRSS